MVQRQDTDPQHLRVERDAPKLRICGAKHAEGHRQRLLKHAVDQID
jgi:hypothetical protein